MNQLKKPTIHTQQSGLVLPIAILIVVVLIVAGGAGYYFYKTSWETYQNEEYGFEMKYPENMGYRKISGSTIEFAYPDQKFTDNTGIYAEMPVLGNVSVVIEIWKNISYKDYTAAVKLKRIITEETEANINGVLFKQVDEVWELVEGAGARPEGTREIHTFIMRNSVIYDIVYYQLPNETDYVNDYYKILSTFKFIEKLEEAKLPSPSFQEREDIYYMKLARETKDINLCEKITKSDAKDVCYSNIALDTKDINLCEKINKSDVKDTCYLNTIPETKDASLCEKIAHAAKQKDCYFYMALETKDANLCEKIIEKDTCYSIIAQKTKDASLCEKIIKSGMKNGCYDKIAEETKDINLCEKISEWMVSTKKNECYIHVAMGAGDISFCEKITDIVEKDVCYFGVVGVTKEGSMCEKMTTSHGKDECYFNVGMITKDINLCEKITDSSMNMKDQCYTHAR